MKKSIGGYFELELPKKGTEFHSSALAFNTGRNALKVILKSKKIDKLFIPSYICDAVTDTISNSKIDFEFYGLNKNLLPNINERIVNSKNNALLYVNYYGLFNSNVNLLKRRIRNLILDNTQAFFSQPLENVDTFYSARKYFGVPDGAYLYTNFKNITHYDQDLSSGRFLHLLTRIDSDSKTGYGLYTENENILGLLPIKIMSKITKRLLSSIDYNYVIKKRNKNFSLLNKAFSSINELKIDLKKIRGPMVYPLLIRDCALLREKLFKNNIYCPIYWKEVFNRCDEKSFEWYLTSNLLPLPIDQRYGQDDMKKIISIIVQEL